MEDKIILQKSISSCMIIFLLISMLVLACAEQPPTTTIPTTPIQPSVPKYGGILRIADRDEGISLGYPPKITRVTGLRQVAPAIESLFFYDKDGNIVPGLANNYKVDSAAKTVTIDLNKGIKFHDGTDFNAEAVKWNLDQSRTAKNPGAVKFKSIDVIDDYTVRINLSDWDSSIMNNLAYIVGHMISPTAYKINGEQWCMNNPVGTGPFKFASWKKGFNIKFEKFDGYWQKGKPYLNGVEINPIFEETTRDLSFRSGEQDAEWLWDAKTANNLEKDGFAVVSKPVISLCYSMVPDSANPKSAFADIRVRQAAQYAIDTEALVKALFEGRLQAADQLTYKGSWAYNPSVIGYPYNPSKAKQLLADAGYANGLKTKLLFTNSPSATLLFTSVQAYFKAVGIDLVLDPAQSGRVDEAMYGNSWNEGLLYMVFTGDPDVTAAIYARLGDAAGSYKLFLRPDDLVKTMVNATGAKDFETKKKYTQELMKIIIDKYCLLTTLYNGVDTVGLQKYVRNHGFLSVANPTSWTPANTWLDK